MTQPGARFEHEIAEQPDVIARLLTTARPVITELAARVRAAAPAFALIAARGSSDNAARYAQYVLGARQGLAVALAAPSLTTRYGRTPHVARALALGISQSGQSPDIVAVLAAARAQGGVTAAITNDPDSPLAQAVETCVALGAGPEQAVAASKTYTAQLAAVAMLSAALEDDPAARDHAWAELAAVPAQLAATLTAPFDADDARLAELAQVRRWAVVGRGYNLATAWEVALKLKETCYVAAEAYSAADFLHGPVATVEPGFAVLLVAPTDVAADDIAALVAPLGARGATLVVLSDQPALRAHGAVSLALPTGVPGWLSPIAAAVGGQRFALALARAAGRDPDQPLGLAKVTRTR